MQDRNSNTAIDNWKNYWENGKPVFSCGRIIDYLKHYAKENDACAKGLKLCLNCPRFKEFITKNLKPKGFAKTLNIKKIAEKKKMLSCLKCLKEFQFNERLGWFECSCQKGGIKKFMKMCLVQENKK